MTSTVCSHWADSERSLVTMVQPSPRDLMSFLPRVDHGLDGEDHAWLEFFQGARAAVVQHLRLFVELLANAVTAELAHHGKPLLSAKV